MLTIMIPKTLKVKEEEVTLMDVVVVMAIMIKTMFMVTTVFSIEIILTIEVVIMIVVMAMVKETTITMLHKLIIPVNKIMKLVPLKTIEDLVSDVEVQTTCQKLVAHLHIYVSSTRHLLKEKRKK